MNVLLTFAGRRNYLVKFFQEALEGQGQVFAADASESAPALAEADKGFVVPDVTHEDYLDILLAICKKYRVRLLISLHDLELPLFARERARFEEIGTQPIVSSPNVIEVCFDKWATVEFLESCELRAPRTYLSLAEVRAALSRGEVAFPLVVKPRWGTGSIGLEYPENDEELELIYRLVKRRLSRTYLAEVSATDLEKCIMIQEKLQGQEYGLDVINNLDGQYVCTFVKRKLVMRAGETDQAVTVSDPQLERLGEVIARQLGHVGNLDCDVFVNGDDRSVLELNPRFGGGYPFSHVAGANLPAAIIAWADGKEADPNWFKIEPDVMASKCPRLVAITKNHLQFEDGGTL
jgi:carbamoyl-phosphate synthase large subunit